MPVSKLSLGPEHGDVLVRYNELAWGMNAIIFIHGLGESRGIFLEAFERETLAAYNLFAPDLPGFGNSPGGLHNSLAGMLRCLEAIIEHFRIPSCVLVGHGLGGDLANWLAQRRIGRRVRGVVNIEGTLGESALHYGDEAIHIAEDSTRTYHKWFQTDFAEQTIRIPNMGGSDAYRRYYESLLMCRPAAFLALAREMREKLHADPADPETIEPWEAFKRLECPKCYCLAGKGHNAAQRAELERSGEPHLIFENATHWLMIDEPLPFYAFLETFTRKHLPRPNTAARLRAWFMQRFRHWLDGLLGLLKNRSQS